MDTPERPNTNRTMKLARGDCTSNGTHEPTIAIGDTGYLTWSPPTTLHKSRQEADPDLNELADTRAETI